jgi:hypothetical protein
MRQFVFSYLRQTLQYILSVLCSNHVNLLSQFDWKDDLFLFPASYSLHVSTVFSFLEGGGASPRNLCKAKFVSNMRRQTVSFFCSFQIHNKKKLLICSTKN